MQNNISDIDNRFNIPDFDFNKIFSDPMSFEDAVGTFLISLCAYEKKEITRGFIKVQKGFFYPDYILPDGCNALKCPPKTMVEIKSNLTYNLSRQILNITNTEDFKNYNLLIITLDEIHIPIFENKLKGGKVRFLTFSKLLDIAKDIPKTDSPEIRKEKAKTLEGKSDSIKNNEAIDNIQGCVNSVEKGASLDKANHDFNRGNVTLFLGAGVSASAGLPSWDSLLKNILNQPEQAPLSEEDYPAICVATYGSPIVTARHLFSPFVNDGNKKNHLIDLLKDALYSYLRKPPYPLIDTIAEICSKVNNNGQRFVSSIITLNYDDLIEEGLDNKKIDFQTVFGEGIIDGGVLPVIHVHGILQRSKPNTVLPVLSEEEYHDLYKRAFHWSNVEMLHAFYRNTCIFIGLSMSDPNLRRLLEFVAAESNGNIPHYAILPKRYLTYHNWDSANPTKYYQRSESKEIEFIKRQEQIFKRLGINVIWYENGKYEQIPIILKQIAGI